MATFPLDVNRVIISLLLDTFAIFKNTSRAQDKRKCILKPLVLFHTLCCWYPVSSHNIECGRELIDFRIPPLSLS